jgi:adenylate cyclase
MATRLNVSRRSVSQTGRRLAAVVSADVVGYSRLVERDEEGTVSRLKTYFRDIVRPTVELHGGRIVKLMGDGVLIEFPSVVEAARSSLEMQEKTGAAEAVRPEAERIRYRVGIHLGDVIIDGEDIQGHGVNVASRLESLAEPGGICVSDAVRTALGNSVPVAFKDLGPQQVKNIAEPVHAYRIVGAAEGIGATTRSIPRKRLLLLGLGFAILAAIVLPYSLGFKGWRTAETGVVTPVAAAIPGIAVLPFLNMSEDKNQEFFVDGLTEDLIIDLSNLSGLFVISRNSAFSYKGQAVKPQRLASDLGVTYVLNGSVRRAGDRVRITAELIDAKSNRQIWSNRYDRQLTDVFAVQDEVKKQIVSALSVTLSPRDQSRVAAAAPTKNIEAYEYYLRGRQAIDSAGGFRSLSLAYWSLEKAVALDPNFAEAYAELAKVNVVDATSGGFTAWWYRPPQRTRAQALILARKAASLKPELSIPEIVLARLSFNNGEYDEAIDHARRAVAHEPGNSDAHYTYAQVLEGAGLHREAKLAIEELFRRDPKPVPAAYGLRGAIDYALRDHAKAIASLEQGKALAASGGLPWAEFLLAAYGQSGRTRDAQAVRMFTFESILNYDIARVRFWAFYRKPEDTEYLIDGLRKAGAPELPYGFDPAKDSAAKLTDPELKSLLFGNAFTAQCMSEKLKSVVSFAADGATSWTVREDLADTGTSRVNGEKLCMTFPYFTFGHETCMDVYRNGASPRFELGRQYEFVLAGPDLCYFSLRK